MRALADTSCLVAAMVEAHPAHDRAAAWLDGMLVGRHEILVCAHSLAELYAVLTRLPLAPRIAPGEARQLVRENVETAGRIVALGAADYAATLDRMARLGLSGGVVYDALALAAAEKAAANRLVTLNAADFQRLLPRKGLRVVTP